MDLHSALLRSVIQPCLLHRDGYSTSSDHHRHLLESQYWPRERLLQYQLRRLQRLLDHAYQYCPYYRNAFDERGLNPTKLDSLHELESYPVLTRRDIHDHGATLLATCEDPTTLQKVQSGGTTLFQIIMYRSVASSIEKLAASWRFEEYMGYRQCDKMAYFWPSHVDHTPHKSAKRAFRERYLDRRIVYYTAILTDSAHREIYQDYIRFRPSYLKVFPSPLERFVEYLQRYRLTVPPVRAIMSTGEVLHPYQRRMFETAFGCRIFDMYGSREVGNTASECCAHEGCHIAMETSIVEFRVDDRVAEPGEEGDILITDLTNLAFPLIRYRIEDSGTPLSRGCSCGRTLPLMRAGVGRISDHFYTRDGSRHSGLELLTYILDTGKRPVRSQIIQKTIDQFLVRFVASPSLSAEIHDHYEREIKRALGADIEVTFEVVDDIPQERSGKTRLLICEIDPSAIGRRQPIMTAIDSSSPAIWPKRSQDSIGET